MQGPLRGPVTGDGTLLRRCSGQAAAVVSHFTLLEWILVVRGMICDVEQVPGAVAGARNVAVAGPGTLQGTGTLRWQGQ